MFTSVENQAIYFSPIKDKLRNKLQELRIPSSEPRALLVTMDTILVLLAALAAFRLWEWSANLPTNFTLISSHWYWVPLLLGGWWGLACLNDLYDIPSSNKKIPSVMRMTMVTVSHD